MTSGTAGLEAWFFSSLANVGHCRKHSSSEHSGVYFIRPGQHVSAKRELREFSYFRRPRDKETHPKETKETEEGPFYLNTTKEELMALVDEYAGNSFTDQLPLLELPNLYQPSDGPHLTVSDKEEDEWPPRHYTWRAGPETDANIVLLDNALRDSSRDPEDIYKLYRALPAPRAPYLESGTRHRLLRRLSVVERKDEHSMLRYFSVIDDMKGTAIPLSTAEWTSAISFAARYVSKSTEAEVEAALQMWREMEHVVGVKGNDATFNVLFDVACKAGKFTLAEMIYNEMEARGFKYNRYHHVSQIHFYGLRGDGDGAREAYKTLVEAGEIVDTVVLNAMISALIRSHEAHAAENVYERMKKAHLESTSSKFPSRDFKSQREINRSLLKLAKIGRRHPSKLEKFQQKSIIAPDLHTYRILINYFAVRAGELDKVAKFLDEMKWFRIPLHGAVFLALVKGFALHGGIRYTEWTADRLESVWKSFNQAIDDGVEGLYISKWIVVWLLRAFLKCSGKSRTIDIWEEMRQRWKPSEEDMDFIMRTLRLVIDGKDLPDTRFDWLLGTAVG
jgi:pentatricopeptide repeat protein